MTAPLPFVVTLPVLGHPTRFETDSATVLRAVHESFGTWASLHPRLAAQGEPFVVRVLRAEGDEGAGAVTVRHRCPDATRVIVQTPGSMAVSDPSRREAVAYVTDALVALGAPFRTELLEAITLALLSDFDRHPVHAAALVHDGRALLLSAPSGTGKSSLAYVARRAGVAVLSEDRVWVQRTPALRVWGWPDAIRLRDDAPRRFPEVAALATAPHRKGAPRFAIAADASVPPPLAAERVRVCVLERGIGAPALERADGETLAAALARDVAPGFDRFPARQHEALGAITRGGGWRLTLSDDPHESLPLLMQMLTDPR